MTQEEIKAAVLAECERLCQSDNEAQEFIWGKLVRDNHRRISGPMFYFNINTVSGLYLSASIAAQTGQWSVAYALLGLNKPADTKWERLKAEIVSRNEAEVEAIKSLPPIGLPQSVRDAAYATGHVLGWIQGTMTRIEQEESK